MPIPSLQLFDQLLKFPLFQGMSRSDLEQIAGRTRLDFVKHSSGKVILREGESSTRLCLLLSGTLEVTTVSDDHSYSMTEHLQAPFLLQPETIFGYQQRYTATFSTLTPASFMLIDKEEVMRLSSQLLVFRINLLNIFATQTQKQNRIPWRRYPATLEERIVRFIAARCIYPAGPKTLRILMTQLALEIGDSRLDVSRALNRLAERHLLTLHRGRIEIPQLEHLLTFFEKR